MDRSSSSFLLNRRQQELWTWCWWWSSVILALWQSSCCTIYKSLCTYRCWIIYSVRLDWHHSPPWPPRKQSTAHRNSSNFNHNFSKLNFMNFQVCQERFGQQRVWLCQLPTIRRTSPVWQSASSLQSLLHGASTSPACLPATASPLPSEWWSQSSRWRALPFSPLRSPLNGGPESFQHDARSQSWYTSQFLQLLKI